MSFSFKPTQEKKDVAYRIESGVMLQFGKHEGEYAEDVVEEDPSYILWLDASTQHSVEQALVEIALDSLDGMSDPIPDMDYYFSGGMDYCYDHEF